MEEIYELVGAAALIISFISGWMCAWIAVSSYSYEKSTGRSPIIPIAAIISSLFTYRFEVDQVSSLPDAETFVIEYMNGKVLMFFGVMGILALIMQFRRKTQKS